MSAHSSCVNSFTSSTRSFTEAGWPADGLLPAIPINAQMSPSSRIRKEMLGKIPGRWTRQGWAGLTGDWPRGLRAAGLTQDEISAWPTSQVCCVGAEIPALDIDIEDADLAARIEGILMKGLDPWIDVEAGAGGYAVRTRAGTGRRIVPLNPVLGPIGSWSVRFEKQVGEGLVERAAIEMIASGRQWICSGGHQSGYAYEWPRGIPRLDRLPAIVDFMSDEMRLAAIAAMEAEGWTVRSSGGGSGPSGARSDLQQIEAAADVDLLRDLFARLTEADAWKRETAGGHDDCVALLASAVALAGRSIADLQADIVSMCRSYGEDEDADAWAEARIASFRSAGVATSGDHFLSWAREQGAGVEVDAIRRDGARRAFRETTIVTSAPRGGDEPGGAEGDETGGQGGAEDDEPGDDLDPEARLEQLIARACKQLVYFEPENAWVFVRERITYSLRAFNDSMLGRDVADAAHAVALAQWDGDGRRPTKRAAHAILLGPISAANRIVKARTYAFGDGPLVRLDMTGVEMPYLNTAKGPSLRPLDRPVSDDDVRPLIEHLEMLLPDPAERQAIVAWMAWVLQNPKGKIRWAPVLVGPQGRGKDTLFSVLVEGVGRHNVEEVRADKLGEKFTSFFERRVILVTEMSNDDRNNVYERVKSAVTGTAAGVQFVERKRIDPYPTLDRSCWVILTNHEDGISMAPDDRRFYVAATSTGAPPPQEYFDRLYDWLQGGGYRLGVTWLLRQDCSAISPNRPPAATQAKEDMMFAALPAFPRWLVEQLEDPSTRWGRRTILGVGEVQRWVDANSHLIPPKVASRFYPRGVREALQAAKWHELGQHRLQNLGVRHRVWARYAVDVGLPVGVIEARLRMEMAQAGGDSPFDVVEGEVWHNSTGPK